MLVSSKEIKWQNPIISHITTENKTKLGNNYYGGLWSWRDEILFQSICGYQMTIHVHFLLYNLFSHVTYLNT